MSPWGPRPERSYWPEKDFVDKLDKYRLLLRSTKATDKQIRKARREFNMAFHAMVSTGNALFFTNVPK